ncbi:MAG: smoF [Aeromicrobium sp.]|nr:smoF [Aeromicrobium sp.]
MTDTLTPPAPVAETEPAPFSSRITTNRYGLLLVAPVLVLTGLIVVYPVGYSLYMSLTSSNPITGSSRFVWFENYTQFFASADFWRSLVLTLVYVACVTVMGTIVALGSALLLREKFFGRRFLMAVIVLPWALSTYAAAVVWRYVYSPQFGFSAAVSEHLGAGATDFLTSATVIPALALVHAWQFAPLGTYFLLATLQMVPDDLYKLARVDGVGLLGRFRHITMPYVRLPLAIFLVLIGGQAATAFDLIYFLTSGGPGGASRTLPFLIYEETFQDQRLGSGAAMSWVLLLVIVVLTVSYYVFALRVGARKNKGEDE